MLECHTIVGIREARYSQLEGDEIPEGNIMLTFKTSSNAFGSQQPNGNHREATRKSSKLNGQKKIQIMCLYHKNVAEEGDKDHRYQNKEDPQHAWRTSPQVLHPEAEEGGGLLSV